MGARASFHDQTLQALAELSHLDLRGPHDLRHTFATWLEDAAIPSRVIGELMGHAGGRRDRGAGGSPMGRVYRETTPAMLNRTSISLAWAESGSYCHWPLICQVTTSRCGGSQASTRPQSHSLPSVPCSYQAKVDPGCCQTPVVSVRRSRLEWEIWTLARGGGSPGMLTWGRANGSAPVS
jgi:hypothetical protein